MKFFSSVFLSLIAVLLLTTTVVAQPWNLQIVDNAGDAGVYSRIVVTSDGAPYIFYWISYDAYLAYWVPAGGDDGGWERIRVEDYGKINPLGLAVDGNDHIHLCWSKRSPKQIRYAVLDSQTKSWIMGPEAAVSLTSDAEGIGDLVIIEDQGSVTAAIAYVDDYPYSILKIATRDSITGWSSETICEGRFAVLGSVSMVADSTGRLHVSFQEGAGSLMYATNANPDSLWVSEYVDISGNVGLYTSIVVEEGNVPYIVYYDVDNGDLKYAKLVTE